jgi:hypothetical protein
MKGNPAFNFNGFKIKANNIIAFKCWTDWIRIWITDGTSVDISYTTAEMKEGKLYKLHKQFLDNLFK